MDIKRRWNEWMKARRIKRDAELDRRSAERAAAFRRDRERLMKILTELGPQNQNFDAMNGH